MTSEERTAGDNLVIRETDGRGGHRNTMLLFLHGWAQNAVVFQNRTKTLTRKLNRQGIACVFLDAPFRLPRLGTTASGQNVAVKSTKFSRQNARAWFLYNAENPSDRSASQFDYVGLDQSISILKAELEQMPDHISNVSILGFSQGAVLAHVIASLASHDEILDSPWKKIQNFIFMGGFPAKPSQLPQEHLQNLDVRSLHLIGSVDTSVPPNLGHSLSECFDDAQVLVHDKGHIVPQQSAVCSTIADFVLRDT